MPDDTKAIMLYKQSMIKQSKHDSITKRYDDCKT